MKSSTKSTTLGCFVLLIVAAVVECTEKSAGKQVTLKNCDCTCYEEDFAHLGIFNVNSTHTGNAYSDAEVTFVTRAEWNARPPTKMLLDLIETPAPYVVISHTATKSCFSRAQCLPHIRPIQNFHIESHGWLDIGYNFLVGGDGLVYIGRGWDKQGAYTHRYHERSIEISFIGTFTQESPTEAQLATTRKLLQIGVREKKLDPNFKLLEHKQVGVPHTRRPGDRLYDIIKTWPHWDPALSN